MKDKFDFSYSFSSNEEDVLKFWDETKAFEKLKEKNKDGKKYRYAKATGEIIDDLNKPINRVREAKKS